MNRRTKIFAGVIVMALAVGTVMSAQVPATVTLRSGEVLSVTMMDLMGAGFQVRVNGTERMIPKDQVAVVDFGGNVTPQASWFDGIGGLTHLVVLKNGDTLKTEWIDIGGSTPLVLTFTGDRQMNTNEVARIYLVAPAPGAPPAAVAPGASGPQPDGSITVNAADPWTSTGLNVRSGEFLRFSATREIRVGPGANDISNANGNPNVTGSSSLFRRLPVTRVPVGTLIAKVGNGRPFELGAEPPGPVRMPATGTLFLGINDLTFNDNSGWFRVVVTRAQ